MTINWTATCFGLWWPSSNCLGGNVRTYCKLSRARERDSLQWVLTFPSRQLDDGHHRPKHVVVQCIVIKLHPSDTVVFDYPQFSSSLSLSLSHTHTHNEDYTIPRTQCVYNCTKLVIVLCKWTNFYINFDNVNSDSCDNIIYIFFILITIV